MRSLVRETPVVEDIWRAHDHSLPDRVSFVADLPPLTTTSKNPGAHGRGIDKTFDS